MMMFKAQEINMLDTNMKTQLKAYLEKLTKPVELIATLDDSAKSAEIKELLAEIAELSDKVTFKEDNSLPVRKPSFLITNPGSNQGPRFAGSPLGHEFTSLVLALLWTGGHPSKKRSLCWSRFAILTVILNSKPITRSLATTARMWCRR